MKALSVSGPILKNDAHCYAVILFETQTLAAPFLACLQGKVTTVANELEVHVGGLDGKKVAAAVVGEEAPAAAKHLETLLPVHSPSLVISLGTATSLTTEVLAGSLFLAERVVAEEEGTIVELKFGFDAASLPECLYRLVSKCRRASVYSSRENSPSKKIQCRRT